MATAGKNLSEFERSTAPSAQGMRFGIVVSEWNNEITAALLKGAQETLIELGASEKDIHSHYVPGSFELPTASLWLAEIGKVDAVIAIGSVIQGETRHFEFVCQAVAQGVKDVAIKTGIPTIFCVLTDDNITQSRDRAGGQHGNKGVEAAVAAVKMAALKQTLKAAF
jgi:6,7-dimethyl-8-ribityllumazine synthase